MSDVLFLASPSHGHVNPTLGLVDALVRRGERVTYFASEPFRERVEATGATFKAYAHDLDMFKGPPAPGQRSAMLDVLPRGAETLADIFAQTQYRRFHYLVHSAPFPFTKPAARLLELPTVASHAVFAGLGPFIERDQPATHPMLAPNPEREAVLRQAASAIGRRFGVPVSTDLRDWLFNPGELNLVYTSRLFAGASPHFDDSYRFVGPPVHARTETTDFPLERIAGKRVLYISLGTVFGQRTPALVDAFISAFARWNGVVVMAAYGVDTATWRLPANFIVRHYVPQGEVLKHATAAVTHAGMNSISDLLAAEVPFVCLPMGADQPALASRAHELGATLVLDHATLTPQQLEQAIDRVTTEPSFRTGIHAIAESFRAAGGYPRAADEVFAWKRARGIH
ncbi:MAG: macrolide family glycosyltransferase [Burkholderiaceae bacterium]